MTGSADLREGVSSIAYRLAPDCIGQGARAAAFLQGADRTFFAAGIPVFPQPKASKQSHNLK
jgi:hypothetical protein